MKHVIYRLLMSSEELRLFDKIRVFLDEDYSSAEHFTVSCGIYCLSNTLLFKRSNILIKILLQALGNFYFVHESLSDVLLWDFNGTYLTLP